MRKNTLWFILVLFIVAPGALHAWSADDQSAFSKANQFYKDGKFKDAAAAYQVLARKYPEAAVFQYDLGNAYFRAGNPGESILAYERAKLAEPRNGDIRYNLNFVRNSLEYKIEDKRTGILQIMELVLRFITEQEAAAAAFFIYFLLIAGICISLLTGRGLTWGFGGQVLLSVLMCALLVWGGKKAQEKYFRDAIVMQNESAVRYGPSESDKIALRLGEGLKVYVMDKRDEWSRVLLLNGESGWIKNANIAEVRKS